MYCNNQRTLILTRGRDVNKTFFKTMTSKIKTKTFSLRPRPLFHVPEAPQNYDQGLETTSTPVTRVHEVTWQQTTSTLAAGHWEHLDVSGQPTGTLANSRQENPSKLPLPLTDGSLGLHDFIPKWHMELLQDTLATFCR